MNEHYKSGQPRMTTVTRSLATLLLACVAAVAAAPDAHAQDASTRTSSADRIVNDDVVNRPLLIVGATLFAGSYLPSLAFATLGDWDTDNALTVPVAGPWMALANPENKPLSKVLLINSGVMQGVGVLSMMASLLIPNYGESTTVRFGKSDVRMAPTQLARDAYGLGASGSF